MVRPIVNHLRVGSPSKVLVLTPFILALAAAGCSGEGAMVAGEQDVPSPNSEDNGSGGVGSGGVLSGSDGGSASGGLTGESSSGGAPSTDSDPTCEYGVLNSTGSVCCDASCGTCGGLGCEGRPGGESACCTGPILASGMSCSSAKAPCALGDPGNSGTGGTGNDGVPQPPAVCSNANFSIPEDVEVHVIIDKHVVRADFDQIAQWYTEDGNTQRFQLHEGDQNQENPNILRPRVEAYAPSGDIWSRTGPNDWHEFSANYYLDSWDSPWRYAVFQIKTNDASNFILQGLIDKDGSLNIARRGKGWVTIDEQVFQKPFHLRVRSDGFKFEVYYNCELVLAENHPQPELESNNTRYGWRWGLYRQEEEQDDTQKGTTTMFVTGPKWD